jgi:hypothetical protein
MTYQQQHQTDRNNDIANSPGIADLISSVAWEHARHLQVAEHCPLYHAKNASARERHLSQHSRTTTTNHGAPGNEAEVDGTRLLR